MSVTLAPQIHESTFPKIVRLGQSLSRVVLPVGAIMVRLLRVDPEAASTGITLRVPCSWHVGCW